MTELRRMKMKVGDAEFEADVAGDAVQPMYDQFLSMLGHRRNGSGGTVFAEAPPRDAFDPALLKQIFDVHQDGAVVLRMLPAGPDKEADAMLLLLYGYYVLKNEECVLATHLFRAAEHSGISVRRPTNECARNGRFVICNGQRNGSHYALSSQGHAMAEQIISTMFGIGAGTAPAQNSNAWLNNCVSPGRVSMPMEPPH